MHGQLILHKTKVRLKLNFETANFLKSKDVERSMDLNGHMQPCPSISPQRGSQCYLLGVEGVAYICFFSPEGIKDL